MGVEKYAARIAEAMPETEDGNPAKVAGVEVLFGSRRASTDFARRVNRSVTALVRIAVAAERERCARIVEGYDNTEPDRAIAAAAAEIRGGK